MVFIRPETPADVSPIYSLHAACFPTTAEARLVSLLRQGGHLAVSLVADLQGETVGHVAFSPVTTSAGAIGIGLGPVAVVGPHRRQGVARHLIEAGLIRCRSAGYGWAVVLGDPAYYSRFRFLAAASFGLTDEYGGGQAFQVLALTPGEIPVGAGVVRYAPEFASLGSTAAPA